LEGYTIKKQLLELNEKIRNEDGLSIDFIYLGESKRPVDVEELKAQIIDYLNNNTQNSITSNIRGLRSFLRVFKEKRLVFAYEDQYVSEKVSYDNGRLTSFEISEKNNDSYTVENYCISYKPGSAVKITIADANNTKVKSENYINILSKISYSLDQIEELKENKLGEISNHNKLMVQMYYLFYNELPDFSSDEINIKFMVMAYICSLFGVIVEDDFQPDINGMPYSFNLDKEIDELYPYGVIPCPQEKYFLDFQMETIRVVGNAILESIKSSNNQLPDLINISRIISKYLSDRNTDNVSKDLHEDKELVVSAVNVYNSISGLLVRK